MVPGLYTYNKSIKKKLGNRVAGTRLAIVNYMLSFVYIKRSNQGSFNTIDCFSY